MKGAGKQPSPKTTMEAIRALQKRYCSSAMVLGIAIALLLIVLGHKPLARGLVLGTLFSVFNFILMGQTLKARIGKTQAKTRVVALVSVLSRLGLMCVPLIIALSFESYHIVTAVLGLFMVQLVMLLEGIKNLIRNRSTAPDIGK